MRYLIPALYLLTLIFLACRENEPVAEPKPVAVIHENTNAATKNDTLWLTEKCAVQFIHDTLQLERMKQQMGDDFYTVADDANFYSAEASAFLDSVKIPVRYIKNTKYLAFETNYKMAQIVKTDTLTLFNLFLFDPKNVSPMLADITNIREEYDHFINTDR